MERPIEPPAGSKRPWTPPACWRLDGDDASTGPNHGVREIGCVQQSSREYCGGGSIYSKNTANYHSNTMCNKATASKNVRSSHGCNLS
jgi:hypothetical protein